MNTFSEKDAKRMVKQEVEIENLREVINKEQTKTHNSALVLQQTTFNLQQCDEEHERTHKNNHVFYEYYQNLKQSNQEFFKTVGAPESSNVSTPSTPTILNPAQELAFKTQEAALRKIEAQMTKDGTELLVDAERKNYITGAGGSGIKGVTINVNLKEKKT